MAENHRELPLISVLIPVYNTKKYLNECLDSIIHQTYKNLEIILVDDGSTDGAGELCDTYAEQDARIHVFHKENSGTADARKVAVKKATGAYCACIDSDDWISEDYFEKMAQIITEYEPDLICCGTIRVCGGTQTALPLGARKGYYTEEQFATQMKPNFLMREDGSSFGVTLSAKAYKTELYREAQLLVASGITYGEDSACFYPLIYKCHTMYQMEEHLYYYRFNPNSVSQKGGKGYSWHLPQMMDDTLRKTIDINIGTYREQMNRYLFMIAYAVLQSQFRRCEPYWVIAKEIRRYLKEPYIRGIICNCAFPKSKSYILKKYMLKYKLILPLFIYWRR